MPQEKRKILSPSAGKAQNGARYGTAERSQVSKNGDPRAEEMLPITPRLKIAARHKGSRSIRRIRR